MKMNRTLFKYIFLVQTKAMLFVSFFLFGLIFLFDFAEITRKFPISSFQETIFALELSFYKVPITFCEVLCYAYFITATFSLWSLCHSNQITIMKSIGKSPQQILFPFIIFAIFMALTWLFVAHPLGQLSEEYYERKILKNENYQSEINENIWIDYGKKNQIIFIKKISNNLLEGIHIFDIFKNYRIFAQNGTMKNGLLILKNVVIIENGTLKNLNETTIYNGISNELIQILSKPPQKQNIYQLYAIYNIQNQNNVVLKIYELELHKLIVTCVSFILFSLFAAIICFPINRYKSKTNIALKVISLAIFLRFSNNILESFAYSGVLSIICATWSMTIVLISLSIAILIWKEA